MPHVGSLVGSYFMATPFEISENRSVGECRIEFQLEPRETCHGSLTYTKSPKIGFGNATEGDFCPPDSSAGIRPSSCSNRTAGAGEVCRDRSRHERAYGRAGQE